MTLKTIAVATMAITLSGAGAYALTSVTTAAPAAADERSSRGDMKRVGYRRGGHHGPRGMLGGRETMRSIMREADTDNDNALSQEEIDVFISTKVDGADANGDGDLTIEEFDVIFRELTRHMMVDAFQRLDNDGTGTITAAELEERFGDVVSRMDRNDDGVLSRADRRRGRHGDRHRGRGPRHERRGDAPQGG